MDDLHDAWEQFWVRNTRLRALLKKVKTTQIKNKAITTMANEIAQFYYRNLRSLMINLGIDATELDASMDTLIDVASKKASTNSYKSLVKKIFLLKPKLESQKEHLISELSLRSTSNVPTNTYEIKILDTLKGVSPIAANSYEQAIQDLSNPKRISYKGTAAEFRETIREVLDQLAPDDDVMSSPNFKLEIDTTKPTMKQKTKFILKSRGIISGAQDSPIDSLSTIDELTGKLTRSTYNRGSVSTHTTSGLPELRQLKMYVDAVLCELLEIHKA